MIILDTETTGLPQPGLVPLAQQPEIIEFAAVTLDDETLEHVDQFTTLIRPRVLPLPAIITKITGITEKDLVGQKPFAAHLENITNLFLGQRVMVAHNAQFDCALLEFELRRLGREFRFPWAPIRHCTVELTKHKFPKFPKLDELFAYYFPHVTRTGQHRALQDVLDLSECVRAMRHEGLL